MGKLIETHATVTLNGYPVGPVHGGNIKERLQLALAGLPRHNANQPLIGHLLRDNGASGYRRVQRHRTSDGVAWSGFEFRHEAGAVVVLVPFATAWWPSTGWTFERYACGFATRGVSRDDIPAILARMTRALQP